MHREAESPVSSDCVSQSVGSYEVIRPVSKLEASEFRLDRGSDNNVGNAGCFARPSNGFVSVLGWKSGVCRAPPSELLAGSESGDTCESFRSREARMRNETEA